MRAVSKNKIESSKQPIVQKLVHLFPIPALFVYTLFIVYPIFSALTYSLFEWKGMEIGEFNYFANFIKLFTAEPFNWLFWNALTNNVIYFIITMVVQNGVAFILAYLIYKKIKGAQFFKIAYFMPYLLSTIVVGFLWELILTPNTGVLHTLLNTIGLESWAKPWLGDPSTALPVVTLVGNWYAIGFFMLLFLAGLQSVPQEVIEAARIDGATGFRLIRSVILPIMFQPIVIVIVLTFINSFESFELVFAMQGSTGGPNYSTDLLTVLFYRTAFGSSAGESGDLGVGSALAVVMFALIASLSALFMYYVNKRNSD